LLPRIVKDAVFLLPGSCADVLLQGICPRL
jgi:hypothetical protein